jgi:hypothetical protein
MFALFIATTVLALLYGLVWHDQPARQPERIQLSDKN